MTELRKQLKNWREAGLVTADQAEAISAHEGLAERHRVSPREIFLFVGGLFVLMAARFGLQVLWAKLRWPGQVVVIAVLTLILWVVGEALRRREGPLMRRGAQVSWMVAAWLTAILIGVTFNEWPGLDLKEEWLQSQALIGALPLAVIALLVLPGLPQGLAVATLALGVPFHVLNVLMADGIWGGTQWATYLPFLVVGTVHLAAAEVARRREEASLSWLFNLFGAWFWLFGVWINASIIGRYRLPWDVLLLIKSLMFIAWSVARQSRALLLSGAFWLSVAIAVIRFPNFEEQRGLPVEMLVTGVALIAIGLGVYRLRRRLWPST